MKRSDLRWLVIREFQGLWEAPNLAAPPNAAAVMDGCYPSASGILPMGQITSLFTASQATPNGLAHFQGLLAVGPVQHSSGGPYSADLWLAGGGLAPGNPALVYTRRYNLLTATFDDPSAGTGIGAGGANSALGPVLFTGRRATAVGTPPTFGSTMVILGFTDPNAGIKITEIPDSANPNLSGQSTFYQNNAQVLGALGFHQGRVIWVESLYQFPNMGAGASGVDYPLMRFTDANSKNVGSNYFVLSVGAFNALAAFLVPTDVGNLLLARSRDVHLIQGDLGQSGGPTDYVLSFFTGAAQQTPCVTTEGVFFGRADGPVVFWGGGAGTQDVSFGLKPGFWANISMLPFTGQFAWSEPFVLCPNGYLFDIRSRSWFKSSKLANVWGWTSAFLGTPFFLGANAQKQVAWCAEYGSAGNGNLFQVNLSEDPTTNRINTWIWQSVPFTFEEVPFPEVREVEVLFQNWTSTAADTCKLQLVVTNTRGETAPYTTPVVITAAGADPQLVRFRVPIRSESMQIQLQVTATGATANAGICKEIRVGYREAPGLPRVGE